MARIDKYLNYVDDVDTWKDKESEESGITSPTPQKSGVTTPNAQVSSAPAQPVVNKRSVDPLDELYKQMDAEDSKAYDMARDSYQQNANRAMMLNNAKLLGDIAHLGIQGHSTGNNQQNYAINKINGDDKYLQAGEAWRQKIGQSYVEEVAARNKQKRELMLQKLKDERDRDRINQMYGWREGYYNGKAENEANIAASTVRKNDAAAEKSARDAESNARRAQSYASSVANQNANRNARTEQAGNRSANSGSSSKGTKESENERITREYYEIIGQHPELAVTKKNIYNEDEVVEYPTAEQKRDVVTRYKVKNGDTSKPSRDASSDDFD